jgi:hypothetical protein
MMDFGANDLYVRTIIKQREREASATYRVAEYTQPPRGLRARLATRLAHAAVHLDRDATDRLIGRHLNTAGHGG